LTFGVGMSALIFDFNYTALKYRFTFTYAVIVPFCLQRVISTRLLAAGSYVNIRSRSAREWLHVEMRKPSALYWFLFCLLLLRALSHRKRSDYCH